MVGIGGPDEAPGGSIVLGDEAVDGGLKIDDAAEAAAAQALGGQLGEEALDGVQPRCRGGREVEDPARVVFQPGPHLGVLVRGVVVQDHVHHLADRYRRLNGVQETDELL